MLNSAKSRMPAVDYVSIVRSVYQDGHGLFFGAAASAIAAVTSAIPTASISLFGVAAAFIVVGLFRYLNTLAFEAAAIGADDSEAAEYWEFRATLGGVAVAVTYGMWCFVAFVFVHDGFSELAAMSISIAAMVGVVARNFGLDRLVTLQSLILSVFLGCGLVLVGDFRFMILAGLLILMIVSFRKLAGDVRAILLAAVHERVAATRLATELDTALSTMPHGLCMLDDAGLVTVINEQTRASFLGESSTDFVGMSIETLIASAVARGTISEGTAEYLLAALHDKVQSKLVIGLADGRHCEVTLGYSNGQLVMMLEDITGRVRAQERISHMARYDGLTELANRSFFTEQVQASLNEFAGTKSHMPVMMMIIDIDEFKHVNDTLGHPVGDKVLMEIANRLREVFGPDVLLGRFGGDEFTVFRWSAVSEEVARIDAMAILAALRVPIRDRRDEIRSGASIGIVIADGGQTDIEELLTRSDLALYNAKSGGKGRWCLFHDQMDVEYKKRLRLKLDMAPALECGQLFLHYQPIVSLDKRTIVGCEALVRWLHPELGMISPMQFIPIAEEMGLISEISRFVLNTATRECLKWPEHLSVSVNLSATDFRLVSVEDMVRDALEASGLEPARLIVEITETALIEEREKVATALTELRHMGVGVALDDFGTGYSSLSYLHAMSFTKVKIDRSFIIDIVSNRRAQKLLTGIVQMSHDLDMTVTVEGIETEDQLELLTGLTNIEHAQGYLFGAPLAANAVREIIDRLTARPAPLLAERTGS